jgi:hypothetical protein
MKASNNQIKYARKLRGPDTQKQRAAYLSRYVLHYYG